MTKKQSNTLIFLCWLAYAFAYVGRYNYSATLVRIVEDFGTTRAEAGMVASFFFFAYAGGQLFHGMLNKYYNPRWAISGALVASAVINLLMPICGSIHMMKVLWMLNGFFQAVLWTTLLHILGMYLDDQALKRAVLVMGTTTASGTVISYAASAIFVRFWDWELSFYAAAVLLTVIGMVWFILYKRTVNGAAIVVKTPAASEEKKLHNHKKMTPAIILLFGVILIFGVLNNLIRDGITTWTPSVFYDLFHMPESYSILLTIGLPLLSIFGAWVCLFTNRYIRDHVLLCGVFYAAGALAIFALIFFLPYHLWWVTLICFALSALAMSAVNNVITSLMPLQMRDFADSGRIAGVTNTFCYIGATISSYSLGALADAYGWNGVFYLLLGLSLLAVLICGMYLLIHRRIKA